MSRTDEVGVRARILGARKFLVDAKTMAHEVRNIGDAAEHSDRKIMGLNARVTFLRNSLRLVRPFALITGLGLAAQAASGLAAGAVAAASALAPLGGAMVAFPALGLAAAQGMRAWSFATGNLMQAVGDLNMVLDENSQQFKSLSPQGQAMARSLDRMKRPVLDMQAAVQGGMFPGMEEGLTAVRPLLGALNDEMGLTGRVMGRLLAKAGHMAASAPFSSDLQSQMRANAGWLATLGDAGLDLTAALMDLLVTSRPLVDWIVKSTGAWAANAAAWTAAHRASGSLTASFGKTRKVMSLVAGIAGGVARAFMNIGKAAEPLGTDILTALRDNARAFGEWTGSAEGQNRLTAYFRDMKPIVFEVGRLLRDVTKAFFDLGNQSGGDKLIRQLRTEVLPALVDVTKHVTGGFGPAFMDGIVALSQLAKVLSGGIGPLTLWVRFLTLLATGITWLATNVPGANIALATLVTTLGALKLAMGLELLFTRMGLVLATVKASTMFLRLELLALAASESAVGVAATGMWAAITGPVGLVVLGIAAVAAAAVLLYNKWGWFHRAVDNTWGFIKDHWPLLVGIFAPIAIPIIALVRHFGDLKRMISEALDLAGRLGKKLGSIPGVGLLKKGAGIAGSVGKALMPGMATGGIVRSPGLSLIGERGPELLSFPRGARVDPLPNVKAPSGGNVPSVGGSLAQHTKLDVTVQVPVNIDGRKVADAVGRVTRDRVNRK